MLSLGNVCKWPLATVLLHFLLRLPLLPEQQQQQLSTTSLPAEPRRDGRVRTGRGAVRKRRALAVKVHIRPQLSRPQIAHVSSYRPKILKPRWGESRLWVGDDQWRFPYEWKRCGFTFYASVCLSLSSSPQYPFFLRCVLGSPMCLNVWFVCTTSPLHFPALYVCVTLRLSSA